MTERERRQDRLLAVRTIQADLAAAELRRLRMEQEAASSSLKDLRQFTRRAVAHLEQAALDHDGWLLACAEQELATMAAGRLQCELNVRAEQLKVQTASEQHARMQREQMQKLRNRTAVQTRTSEERQTQARLDDLFSAARVRAASARD